MGSYLRLRQICLVARALEPAITDLTEIFGLEVCYRDGHVARYGLVNALLPIGSAFLEVVAPTREGTAAGRYLERRQGDGGYMVIIDCDDIERRRAHLAEIGVRIANSLDYGSYIGLQLHPRDTGGAMLELNHTPGGERLDGPYHPAGPDWQRTVRTDITTALLVAELQSDDPEHLSARWSELLERPVSWTQAGERQIVLDGGALRFVRDRDGRGQGLGGLDLAVSDKGSIRAAAARHGCPTADDIVTVCGMRFRLRPAA
jgi:hypothetical protein